MSSWRRRAAVRAEQWTRFWDQREAPTSLWWCRVLVSLVVAADLLQAFYLGLVPAAWAAPPDGLGWGVTGDTPPWAVRLFGPSAAVVEWVWALALLFSMLFAVGLGTRASGFALALLLAELARYAPNGDRGVDILLRVAIPVLALSGSHARWSVDAWIRRWRGQARLDVIPAWPRYLLFAQLVWMYSSAAQNRHDPAWWPTGGFAALGTLLGDPHFARFGSGWLAAVYPLTQVATASTMVFEGGSPLLLLWTWLDRSPKRGGAWGERVRRFKVRWLWLAFGVTLHLGIALTMRLGIFSFGVLALYPALVHPSELHAAWSWARRRYGA